MHFTHVARESATRPERSNPPTFLRNQALNCSSQKFAAENCTCCN